MLGSAVDGRAVTLASIRRNLSLVVQCLLGSGYEDGSSEAGAGRQKRGLHVSGLEGLALWFIRRR